MVLRPQEIKPAFTSANDTVGGGDDEVPVASAAARPKLTSQQIARILSYIVLGLVLVAAAAMKAHQLLTEPLLGWPLTGTVALICFELTFGLWLILGNRTRWTHRAALVCFSTFAAVATYKVVTGADSCGCFGAVKVSPAIMLVIDLGAVFILVASRKEAFASVDQFKASRIWFVVGLSLPILLAMNIAIIVRQESFVPLTTGGLALAPGERVVLAPEKWIGQRCPLFDHLNEIVVQTLSQGEWDVILFKRGCQNCHNVLVQLEGSLNKETPTRPIALIAIDNVPEEELVLNLQSLGCLVSSLDATQEWFATTPTRFRLSQGVCGEARVIDKWQ